MNARPRLGVMCLSSALTMLHAMESQARSSACRGPMHPARAHPQTMTADQLTTPDQAEATPDHEPVRPTFTLTEAAQATGTSRSTMKRKLAAGEFPDAAKDADGVWRFSPGDLLAAGLKLRTPADAGRSRRDDEQGDDEAAELLDRIADLERLLTIERVRREAAEQVAAEREKRAMTAERALLMLEARPAQVPTPHPEPVRPAAAESAARLAADSGSASDHPRPGFWRRVFSG